MSERELPEEWVLASIDQVSIKGEQRKPDAEEQFIYVDIGSIDRESKVIASPQRLSGSDAPSRARKVISVGDVLVSLTRPNLNAVALVGKEYDGQIASTGFEVIKPVGVDSRFIFFLVRGQAFIDAISGRVQGALYPAAKSSDVKGYQFPLPPSEEQKVIADKLDELLTQVNHLKARLDAIPAILKRFRQSVLEAAVSGRLTDDWRISGESTPQDKSWGDVSFRHGGEAIPRDWRVASLGELSERVSVGHVGKTSEYYTSEESGVPFLRSQNVKPGRLSKEGMAYISKGFHEKLSKSKLRCGDLLVVRVGANRGDACVLPEDVGEVNCANVVFARPRSGLSEYLNVLFQSPSARELLLGKTVGGAQGVINTKSIAEFEVPVPPIEEQAEIVRRVDQLFAFADQVEQQVKNAQARVDKLTHSILAKAFRGELTAEWRAENPELISGEHSAEALLERVKAEKAKQQPAKTRRGGRKATVTS